jgi:hypothetical protein
MKVLKNAHPHKYFVWMGETYAVFFKQATIIIFYQNSKTALIVLP